MTTDYTNRAREIWSWFRAFPLAAQALVGLAVLCIALAGVNYFTGAVTRATESVRAWAFERQQAKADKAVADKQAEIDAIRVERDQLQTTNDVLRGQNAALRDTLEALGANEQALDQVLTDDARAVEAARAGGDGTPPDHDELVRDLRDLFRKKPGR